MSTTLQPAQDVHKFVKAPHARYVSSAAYVYACVDRGLTAQRLWGRLRERDVAQLVRAYDIETRGRHVALFDASGIEVVDRPAYVPLTRFMRTHQPELARAVTRLALVRPRGVVGLIVEGFVKLLEPIPTRVFVDIGAALEWLDRGDANWLAAWFDSVAGVDPVVRAVRAHLDASLTKATIASVAHSLGVTERGLQRQLKRARTTFRGEHQAAQVRAAQQLLRDTDTKLASIALDVGCSSLQHFSTLFRRVTGDTPTAWRARNRPRT
jgi:AraC-like DNA-binding protein